MRVHSATAGFGPKVPAPRIYLEDPANFANLVTIQGAHTIDLAIAVAGPLADLDALATAQYPEIRTGDDGEVRRRVTFDHLLLHGRFAAGGVLSIEVAGGRPPDTPFRLEVVGETGTLHLDGGAPRGVQSGRLTLSLDGASQHVDEGELAAIPDEASNVSGVYAALRDDVAAGTATATGFDHAVALTRLITDLLTSSRTGTRRPAAGWPEQ